MFDFSALSIPGPEGRANAIKATLTQIAGLYNAKNVAPRDLAAAFTLLGQDRDGDTPPVTARRATCRDIAAAMNLTGGTAHQAGVWFDAQVSAWCGSSDPRQRAMAETARRELAEIICK